MLDSVKLQLPFNCVLDHLFPKNKGKPTVKISSRFVRLAVRRVWSAVEQENKLVNSALII